MCLLLTTVEEEDSRIAMVSASSVMLSVLSVFLPAFVQLVPVATTSMVLTASRPSVNSNQCPSRSSLLQREVTLPS